MNKPSWMGYAVETKARIDRLPKGKSFSERRREIIAHSHDLAREVHNYPGTLLDWDYIVDAVRNGKEK